MEHKLIITSILLIFVLLIGCTKNDKEKTEQKNTADSMVFSGEKHFKNLKKITSLGDNAEAYFSFDTKQIVFQSTKDNFECDQIFTMNLDGSDVKLVSTGNGRTTCAYFLPDGKHVLYASTHLGNEKCPPKPDMSKGYVWGIYDTYDIFVSDLNGKITKQLTKEKGYDAEATVSPKGDKIVFTSVRDGDIDLYSMNLDGSDVKRLTNEIGYDGGAFFSNDGEKIIFRASRPNTDEEIKEFKQLLSEGWVKPGALDIFIMNADGSDIKQITSNGKANFAPFLFPDGKRLIFCSNINDPKKSRNFDLYAINVDGTDLEQITFNETFDGFPMFSIDGKKFVFCSNRFGQNPNQTNVFICDWVN